MSVKVLTSHINDGKFQKLFCFLNYTGIMRRNIAFA